MEDKEIETVLIDAGIGPTETNIKLYKVIYNQIDKELSRAIKANDSETKIKPKEPEGQASKFDTSKRLSGLGVDKPTFI